VAKYLRQQINNGKFNTKLYYYIAPKIWAWKEYRIKNFKRDIDEMFSILPFEVSFFENKHHYPIHYVGNPTADEVREFLRTRRCSGEQASILLLPGSRRQEIKDNLPTMLRAADEFSHDYQLVLAGAPGIDHNYYNTFTRDYPVRIVDNETFALLMHTSAALVTSGTATLETALFGVPQVVCYETPLPWLIGWLRKKLLKVKYVSLVNLIADREVVTELVADTFSQANIEHELELILDGPARQQMLEGYEEVWQRLGKEKAPDNAARLITQILRERL
jgi:lipid-A-disaccharide synthase